MSSTFLTAIIFGILYHGKPYVQRHLHVIISCRTWLTRWIRRNQVNTQEPGEYAVSRWIRSGLSHLHHRCAFSSYNRLVSRHEWVVIDNQIHDVWAKWVSLYITDSLRLDRGQESISVREDSMESACAVPVELLQARITIAFSYDIFFILQA